MSKKKKTRKELASRLRLERQIYERDLARNPEVAGDQILMTRATFYELSGLAIQNLEDGA